MKKLILLLFIPLVSFSQNEDILLDGSVSVEGNQIKNVADPTDDQDAVTLAYINQLEVSNQDLQEQVNNLEANLQDQIDELRNLQNWEDNDQDGFNTLSGDCDDTNASINPNIYEVADGVDNNCNNDIDEGYEGLDYPEDVDANTYNFAIYGSQLWTVENAEMVTYRDGTPIPQVTDQTEWINLTTGAWCFIDNDPTKGRLYNWYAVMGKHDDDPNTVNKIFAPEGWHVPSNEEWTTLKNYLIGNGYNYDGTTEGNKIAKAMASTTGWDSSMNAGVPGNNQSLNNISGFNAFPEGLRSLNVSNFYDTGNITAYWSYTVDSLASAWYINYNEDSLNIITEISNLWGFSVRFVKD